MSDLTLVINNLRFFIHHQLDEVDLSGADPEEGAKLTKLALYYRCLGIAHFLRDADTVTFSDYLGRAVQARSTYLQRVTQGLTQDDEVFHTTPRNRAFFDAVVLRNDAAAVALARDCNDRWNPDREYEDDFLYVRFLQQLALDADESELKRTRERFEVVVDGGESPEFAICRSLHEKDPDGFDEALLAQIEARGEAYATRTDLPPVIADTEAHVHIHGLAAVRLAAARGVATKPAYPTIPGILVALPVSSGPASEAWRQLQ